MEPSKDKNTPKATEDPSPSPNTGPFTADFGDLDCHNMPEPSAGPESEPTIGNTPEATVKTNTDIERNPRLETQAQHNTVDPEETGASTSYIRRLAITSAKGALVAALVVGGLASMWVTQMGGLENLLPAGRIAIGISCGFGILSGGVLGFFWGVRTIAP